MFNPYVPIKPDIPTPEFDPIDWGEVIRILEPNYDDIVDFYKEYTQCTNHPVTRIKYQTPEEQSIVPPFNG